MSTVPDADYIRRALELADLDAVRVTLFHLTGDEGLRAFPRAAAMDERQRADLIDRAAAWLQANAGARRLPEPPPAAMRDMTEMALGMPMGDVEFAARGALPGFADFPYMVDWDGPPPEIPAGFKVVVIGSGFAGVGTGVQLDRLGIPYEVLERRPEAGGVWSINRYPDVRVDTASITYEFMFEKDHVWSEYFGRGADVRRYIDAVSRKFGVHDKTRFEHDVTHAAFDEARDLWMIDAATPDGPRRFEANAIISASGLFATPRLPEFEGQEDFAGRIVHPARWPDDLDLAGKRVAMIGNGSTGVQMLGSIADRAAHVAVFQRTAQWIMPRARYGKPIEEETGWLLRHFPGYSNWWRFTVTAPLFDTHGLMQSDAGWQAAGGKVNRANDAFRADLVRYIEAETGGRRDLIDRLVPDYAPMSRRPVVDNGWYRALTRDNVELVTDPIARLTPTGIKTADGTMRDVDVIVTATGYQVAKYLAPARYVGRGGVDLHAQWDAGDGPRAYVGLMVPNFPNLFTLYGPNSQPISGGPAQPVWFAVWAAFAAQSLMRMLRTGATRVEVKQEAHDRYNAALDAEASKLVQMTAEGGVDRNYYVSQSHGRLQVNAPWYAPHYHALCSDIAWDDLVVSGGVAG